MVWAARWASLPRSCTPGDPWGWRSFAATSTLSTVTGRFADLPCPGFFIIFLQFCPACGRGRASFSQLKKISCTGRCKLLWPVFLFYRDGLYFDSSEKVKNISLFSENGFSWMVVCIQEFAVSHNTKVVLLRFYRLKKQNLLLTERFLCGKTIV